MEELTTVPHQDDIASSSMASASTPYVHYDVYIDFCDYNHCGRDAHFFATKLYDLLRSRSHELKVFLDVPNLLFEDKIPAKVEQAILAASAHITIFPPNYAQSKWCLDKLVLMTKSSAQSRITILPVFYYAKPTELRWTGERSKGAFAEALRYYEKNNLYNSQTIQDWRGALSYVTNISGFVVDDDEEEILAKIVQTILNGFPYGPRYDVFLSHRGPDVKTTFASKLYLRLTSRGLRVFLDELEFVRGFEITPQIEIAIQFAHVNIAILSPTYADSRWCMEELNLMFTSSATILPVFYQVTHSDLRHGVYVEALRNHRETQRYDSMTLQNWGDTLSKVAELPDYYELDGNEEVLVDNIVEGVLKSVEKRSEHLRTCDVQDVVKSVLKEDAKVKITSEVQSAKVKITSEVQSSVKLQSFDMQNVVKSVLKNFVKLQSIDMQNVVKSVLKDNAKVEITSEVQSSVKLQSFDMQNVVKSVLKNCRYQSKLPVTIKI